MSSGGLEGPFSRDPLPVFSAGGPFEQFSHGQGCPLFDVVHPAFPLPTILQFFLKDAFGEAVVACDMLEPCKFPSFDSCQKKFLWTQKEVELAPNLVIGHMLRVGDMEFLHATEEFLFALSCFRKPESSSSERRLVSLLEVV